MHVGLREHAEQPLALPRHVVVAAARVLEVLDPVDAVVEPAIASLEGELVAVLGEHVVRRDPVRGMRQRAVVVEQDSGRRVVGHTAIVPKQ